MSGFRKIIACAMIVMLLAAMLPVAVFAEYDPTEYDSHDVAAVNQIIDNNGFREKK